MHREYSSITYGEILRVVIVILNKPNRDLKFCKGQELKL